MAAHFSESGLKFLRGLAKNNEREWFDARKHLYEAEVKKPMLEIIAAINDQLARFAPEFVRDPSKCMMRIYRDIRFSKNKLPYKTHAAAWWARQGLEKTSGGGFYLEISPQSVRVAAGVYMPEKEQLLAIRRLLLERHEDLRRAMKVKGMKPIDAMKMTRAPKDFPTGHPAMDMILQRQWGIIASLPAGTATQPNLVKEIVKRFKAAAPMVQLLNEPLVSQPRRPLF